MSSGALLSEPNGIMHAGSATPIYIITPCCRPEALRHIAASIRFDLIARWIIVYDRPDMEKFQARFADNAKVTELVCATPGGWGHNCRNFGLDYMERMGMEGMVYNLDDDNLVHPGLWALVSENVLHNDHFYTFDQQRDATGGVLVGSKPRLCHIDTAMFLIPTCLLRTHTGAKLRWIPDRYDADGAFVEAVVAVWPERWQYLPGVRAYYNRLHYATVA